MPKTPAPPSVAMPPPSAYATTLGSSSLALSDILEKQKATAANGKGNDNTILTSPQGTGAPRTTKSTLLG